LKPATLRSPHQKPMAASAVACVCARTLLLCHVEVAVEVGHAGDAPTQKKPMAASAMACVCAWMLSDRVSDVGPAALLRRSPALHTQRIVQVEVGVRSFFRHRVLSIKGGHRTLSRWKFILTLSVRDSEGIGSERSAGLYQLQEGGHQEIESALTAAHAHRCRRALSRLCTRPPRSSTNEELNIRNR
jgi:hypothetical protein